MSYEYNCGMWHWMEMQAPETIMMPPYLVVGDCWEFKRVIGPYSGYTGGMTFVAPATNSSGSGYKVSATATVDLGYFLWDFPSSDTADLAPQPYLWSCTMTDPADGCRYTVQSGSIKVVGDVTSAAPPAQTQSKLQLLLDKLDQQLLDLADSKVQSVQYAGQMYTLHNIKDLWGVRMAVANQVADEQAVLSGNSRSDRIIPRFVFR